MKASFALWGLLSITSAFAADHRARIAFPGSPTSLEVRIRAPGTDLLECPVRIPACPRDVLAAEGPIVLDPGHNDSNAGTRSDPSYIEASGREPAARAPASDTVKYYEPFEGGAKPSSRWTQLREDERAPLDPKLGFSPYIHEGRGNLVVSILAKLLIEKCVFRDAQAHPSVHLTHWPGESVFGEYEHPDWAARARQRVGGEPFVMAESKFEHLNKKDDTATVRYDYNSNFGTPYNSRLIYANHLLGLADPFARRIATLAEIKSAKPLPPGVFNPADPASSSTGFFVSIHEDTKPIRIPEGYTGDRRKLRAPDQVLVAYPRVPYLAGPMPATLDDYEIEPPSATPEQNPSGGAMAARMGAILGAEMQPFYPKALPVETQPRPLLLLARNVLVERKVLVEGFDMTGGARDRVEAEIKRGDRRMEIRGGHPARITLDFSDLHLRFARGVAAAVGAEFCGVRP
jgi:hypothetical protein